MGDRPLRPPTRRSLGGPLPRQLANGARAHPRAKNFEESGHAAILFASGITPRFHELFRTRGQVAHVLLTLAPLSAVRRRRLVRLACLIHAASVQSEPGSNSPLQKWSALRPRPRSLVTCPFNKESMIALVRSGRGQSNARTPFPHGTSSLSITSEYLAFPGGPGSFPQDSSCPVVLGNIAQEVIASFIYRAVTFFGDSFQKSLIRRIICNFPTSLYQCPATSHYPRFTTRTGFNIKQV